MINARDKQSWTAQHLASTRGHADVVKALIRIGAIDVNLRARGSSALHEAAREGHANEVKLLLRKRGIKINARDDRGATALQMASRGRFEITTGNEGKATCEHEKRGARGHGSPPRIIPWPCRCGQTALGSGRHQNQCPRYWRWDPAFWASVEGHKDVLELLLRMGELIST